MAAARERWYTADFDQLDWRGVHVHGFRIVEGEGGLGELQLDLDFLLDRPADAATGDGFLVAQAMLQFHEVSGLRFMLDYVACSAGMSAFAIAGIVREPLVEDETSGGAGPEYGPWRWRIAIDWPEGALEFESTGFSLWLVGDAIPSGTPILPPALRS
jgi:hypothetical protein